MGDITVTPAGFPLLGGRLCLDFCNTVERRPTLTDFLANQRYTTFVRWCLTTQLITQAVAEECIVWQAQESDAAEGVFNEAVELREAIYQMGLAVIEQQQAPPQAMTHLNAWIQRAQSARQIQVSETGFEWVWINERDPLRPLFEIALSAVHLFVDEDLTRLRQCPGCGWLFYDHSKNNSRTWCDMRFCGNRAKNKRFHTRHKSAD